MHDGELARQAEREKFRLDEPVGIMPRQGKEIALFGAP